MADERLTGSVAETEGTIRKLPSLALALFPRPELLVAGDSWLASGGSSDRTDGSAPNAMDSDEDSTGGR